MHDVILKFLILKLCVLNSSPPPIAEKRRSLDECRMQNAEFQNEELRIGQDSRTPLKLHCRVPTCFNVIASVSRGTWGWREGRCMTVILNS